MQYSLSITRPHRLVRSAGRPLRERLVPASVFQPVHSPIKSTTTSEQRRTQANSHHIVQAAAVEPEKFTWGADMKNLAISVGCGVLLWFLPSPAGVSAKAWHLLAIFISTIVGIITTPLPLGAVAMIGLAASMVTQTLTFTQAFSAFSSEIPCASNSSAAH
jgi:hypothetical protein